MVEIGGMEKQSRRGYRNWSLCKIQQYEHNENNVGFESN